MNALSLPLFDHVVPDVPLRPFVLTLPVPLRILVARDKRLPLGRGVMQPLWRRPRRGDPRDL